MPETGADQSTGPLFVTWQTNLHDGYAHAITDEALAADRRTTTDELEAVCCARVCLADSFSPPGPTCRRCLAFLRARATLRPLDQRVRQEYTHRRAGWLRSTLGHRDRGTGT